MNWKEKFNREYKKLNSEQKKAVDAVDGPVMVIAGPGTGKTQILTLRIANILQKTDIPAEAILALTFTEAGTAAMRKRLAEIIGSDAYRVGIWTFHGFCNDLIRRYPDRFLRIIGAASVTDVDQIRILRDILDSSKLKELRPFGDPYYYLRAIAKEIQTVKQEGVTPAHFAEFVKKEEKAFQNIDDIYYESGAHRGKIRGKYQSLAKNIARNKELAVIYRAYQDALRKSKLYDYSDMLLETLNAFEEDPDFLLILQEQHQYILLDEHQDTNNAQNKIVEKLSGFHDSPNLFVVGDEKQAIYRFQGASLENFLYFKNLYRDAVVIELAHNYRSAQTILDSAHGLAPTGRRLTSQPKRAGRVIELYALSSPEAEAFFLARHISGRLEAGVPAEEIAVLYRENADAAAIAPMLERLGVPFTVESGKNVLEDDDIRKLISILRAVSRFGSPEFLMAVLHIDFLAINPLDIYKLSAYAARNRTNPYDVISSPKETAAAGISSGDFKKLYDTLSSLNKTLRNKGAVEAFEEIVRESGFLAHICAKPDAHDKIAKLHAVFDQIKSMLESHRQYTLDDFLAYLDLLEEHNISVKSHALTGIPGKVRLMTAHGSKGMEFRYVYIVQAYDGHWGSRRLFSHFKLPHQIFLRGKYAAKPAQEISDEHAMQDERNLFYVALTRAKDEVIITYAQCRSDGRELLPSQFILEMRPEFVTRPDTAAWENEFASRRDVEFFPRQAASAPLADRNFLNELLRRQGFSVTALNNYLACPWRYFYRNLIRIPEAPVRPLMYGNAVDEALRQYFDRYAKGEKVNLDFLLSVFRRQAERQPFMATELAEALEKGKDSLAGYIKTYGDTFRRNILNQYKIDGIEIADGVSINGKMDKIEILDDAGAVNVVDYKTGHPKTHGEIEGTTASSDGNYKRQLVFYNLLLNKQGKFKMRSGQIDFIDPDKSGKWRREVFAITAKEIKELEAVIQKTIREILNLSFWNTMCDDRQCRYCALRRIMS